MLQEIRRILLRWSGGPKDAAPETEAGPPATDAPSEETCGPADTRENWKQKALNDFEHWLSELPDVPPDPAGTEVEACDLFTLLSEFTALRQEIRMQNREQHRSVETLEALSGDLRTTVQDTAGVRGDALQAIQSVEHLSRELRAAVAEMRHHFAEAVRREAEKQTVRPFLDIRDALVRGRRAAENIADRRGFFWKPPKETASVIEGYDMALRRFDRALSAVGVHPVGALGMPFDPRTMRAVETCSRTDMEKGIVASEILCGFVRGDEVIRTAEVVVNQ